MEILRTPDERFESLPDFPWQPIYRDWEDIRLAYIDEGDGEPLLLLHGEPTWGFLWRKVMEPLLEAGYRCIVPDLPGFGRSDKPADDDWYTYDRHTAAVVSLLEDLDMTGLTLICHDWGGPIGLRAAATEVPDRFDRLVAMDTGVFTGYQEMSDDWNRFRDFITAHPDVRIDMPMQGGAVSELAPEVIAAYEAPFPDVHHKAGVRSFPAIIPFSPDAPGAAEGQAAAQYLLEDVRPSLLLWADSDPTLPLDPAGRMAQLLFPQAEPLTVIENAGHFLQEDQGEQIGRIITDWLGRTPA